MISLLLSIFGTALAVYIALIGRQLLRPNLVVDVGLYPGKPYDAPRRWRSRRPDAIAVGVTGLEPQNIVLPLLVRLNNKSGVPINDVDVVLEFSGEAAIEEDGLVGPVAGMIVPVTNLNTKEDLFRFRGFAQRRLRIGLVRPGERIICGEVFQLRADSLAVSLGEEDQDTEHLRERYSSCRQLKSALGVRIIVWSSSLKSVSFYVTLIWLAVKDEKDLQGALTQMTRLSSRRLIGERFYFPYPFVRPELHRDEVIEFALVNAEDAKTLSEALTPEGLIDHAAGFAVLRVPPWGLWGKDFDITTKWKGIRLSRDKNKPAKSPK